MWYRDPLLACLFFLFPALLAAEWSNYCHDQGDISAHKDPWWLCGSTICGGMMGRALDLVPVPPMSHSLCALG